MRPARRAATNALWAPVSQPTARIDAIDMPAVIVLALLPTWGATEWMRQCEAHLVDDGGASTRWIRTRRGLFAYLESAEPVRVAFVDDVVISRDDAVWDALSSFVRRHPGSSVVIHSFDVPPPLGVRDVRILTEADVALDADSVARLARLNQVSAPPGTYAHLSTRYRGNPTLARRSLELLRESRSVWSNPDARHEVYLARELAERLRAAQRQTREGSVMLRLIESAAGWRRVSLAMLEHEHGAGPDVHAHYGRFASLPFGDTVVDEETGMTVFEWSPAVWDFIQAGLSPSERRANADRELDLARRTEHRGTQIHALLAAGRVEDAEEIAYDDFRALLLTPEGIAMRAVTGAPLTMLRDAPALLLLAGNARLLAGGGGSGAAQYFEAALEALRAVRPDAPFAMLRHTARALFAHVSLGHRAESRRALDTILEVLDGDGETGIQATATSDPFVGARLAAELYVPYWAATQLDDHLQATALARMIDAHANPRSRTAVAERRVALTQAVFMGDAGPRREDLGAANTDPMILIERGDDAGALDLLQFLDERASESPSRSAAEAFILTVRALVEPHRLDARAVRAFYERSRDFWDDGMASTAVSAATAFATVAMGDAAAALRLLREQPAVDFFTSVTEGMVMLALDRPHDAHAALRQAGLLCDVPRAVALTGALAAAAHLRLGHVDAACRRIEATASATSAGLLRMGLRFIPGEDFGALDEHRDAFSTPVARVLDAARGDTRPVRRSGTVVVTPVEREVLLLLKHGATNAQIAQQRFVSLNTVRSQVRTLLRKLGAVDRDEAVGIAARLGLLDDPPAEKSPQVP